MKRAVATLVVPLLLAGCQTVQPHYAAFRTTAVTYPAHEGPVTVSRTREPDGIPLAVVQVHGSQREAIDVLVLELTRQAARLGADYVKIDRVATQYDTEEETETVSYECGTDEAPQTCSYSSTSSYEAGTTQVVGRAFRLAGR